ncbi:hypothetical protein HOLleu_44473 [Holothuria leucospilota]|uniref:Uncharacterized protein n=1 Tax=Holothuria leucospilota TaxID=206669 RepID=A0A9Q0YDA5_HOLLE|nr:hypothetical protein HOLleu_44473 [Holothuria leucospilota]
MDIDQGATHQNSVELTDAVVEIQKAEVKACDSEAATNRNDDSVINTSESQETVVCDDHSQQYEDSQIWHTESLTDCSSQLSLPDTPESPSLFGDWAETGVTSAGGGASSADVPNNSSPGSKDSTLGTRCPNIERVTRTRKRSSSQSGTTKKKERSRSNIRFPQEDPSDLIKMTQFFLEDEPWHSSLARGCPATFSRFIHPQTPGHTWFRVNSNQSSRIDRIYVPKEVKVCNSETFCLLYFDHNPVYVDFVTPNTPDSNGKGYWKYNVSLNRDKDFCRDLRHHYQMWSSLKPGFDSLSDWWENIKGRIRELAIKHSKRRVRKKRERLNHLQAHCSAFTAEEIDNLIGTEAEGAYIRYRAKFLEFGERPSSYFFRLESRRGSQKIVRSIRGPNGDIFNRKDDIIRVFHDFYSSLYSKERNVDHGLQDSFIHSLKSTIDNNQKNKLDLPISSDEIYSALRGARLKTKRPVLTVSLMSFTLTFTI